MGKITFWGEKKGADKGSLSCLNHLLHDFPALQNILISGKHVASSDEY